MNRQEAAPVSDSKIKVTMTKSLICQKPKIRATAVALGLTRPNRSVILPDTEDAVSYTHLTLPTTERV